jgi:hypothetical protein
MISTEQIEKIFDKLSANEKQQEKLLVSFAEKQPHIAAWLLGESFELLTEEEQDYLFFLGMVIFNAVSEHVAEPEEIDGDELREAEELNWQILEDSNKGSFSDRITIFFEDTEEEDLLAFIEDALVVEEDEPDGIVTKIGREPMFVALKTMADLFMTD